jgi:hypothetical protein
MIVNFRFWDLESFRVIFWVWFLGEIEWLLKIVLLLFFAELKVGGGLVICRERFFGVFTNLTVELSIDFDE